MTVPKMESQKVASPSKVVGVSSASPAKANKDTDEQHSPTEYVDDYEEPLTECSSEVAQEELGDEPRSIILSMLAQVTKGMDLHRIAFPTFVLEPRSMLERITDFMSHPQLILQTPYNDDPAGRFVDVVRYFLSGWHIRPKGVKKPYNPVLGEFFRCRWRCEDNSTSFYISEQVSHHPPVSAYMYANPEHNIVAMGNFKPKSRFLGNSVVSIMQGSSHLFFTNRPGEEYTITTPNVYARGILFGTMLMELGDSVTIRCEKTDLVAGIDFKVKGYFSGSYNAIAGKIKRISTGEVLYELSGKWTDTVYISEPQQSPTVLFESQACPIVPKLIAPLPKQDPFESRRLWKNVTEALLVKDYTKASVEKALVEDQQRHLSKQRSDENVDYSPKFFCRGPGDFWQFFDKKTLLETPLEIHEYLSDFFARNYGLSPKITAATAPAPAPSSANSTPIPQP